MKHQNQKRIAHISRHIGILSLLGLIAFDFEAEAQPVIVQPPQYSVPPSALQEAQNNEMQVFDPAAAFLNQLQEVNPYRWGPVTFRPSLSYSFLYGTGIQSSPGKSAATVEQTISPSFLFEVGSHWTLDYSPSWTFYSSRQFQNSLNHMATLSWGTSYEDWVVGFSQGYARSDSPSVETGTQTDQETYSTALNASYQFNDKISLNMGLSQNLSYVGNGGSSTNLFGSFSSSKAWSTMEWLNYQFWPRLNAGIGVGAGYTIQGGSPDSVNEQYSARVSWRATDKISFLLSGGLQDQQYLSAGASDLVTPIFGATIQYQPFEQTRVSVSASRTVGTSFFQNQVTENTGVTADLNQRLLGKLNLDLNGGYSKTKYLSSTSLSNQIGYGAGRNDNFYSFSARLTYSLLKRGTISAFYQYSENSSSQNKYLQFYQANFSSQSAFSYTSNQIGFEIGYQF